VEQLATFRAQGAIVGGPAGKVYPMGVSTDGTQLLMAGLEVADDHTVTVRFQSCALAGTVGAITGQLEVVVGQSRRGALPDAVAPMAERLLAQITSKLDTTPTPFGVPVMPIANTGSHIRNMANIDFTRFPSRAERPMPLHPGAEPSRDRVIFTAEAPPRLAEVLASLVAVTTEASPPSQAPTVFVFEGPALPFAALAAQGGVPVVAVAGSPDEAQRLRQLFAAQGVPTDRAFVVPDRKAMAAVIGEHFEHPVIAWVPATGVVSRIQEFLRQRGLVLETAGAVAKTVERIRDYLGSQL